MYRNHLHIIKDILELCDKPQPKTRILRKCSVPHPRFKEILAMLLERRLLEEYGKKYATTRKGTEFIMSIRTADRLLGVY
ncbi:MAG: winged helix-turn-helix domain-containing protein [Nitrosotalea sp.]